jgi:hypothetical protein
MHLAEALQALRHQPESTPFDKFIEGIDPDLIEQALETTGKTSLRKRRLPAFQVVWLVIGMALLRNRPMWDVARQLDIQIAGKPVAPSAVVKARQRLGDQPMEWLFDKCAQSWAHGAADRHRWRGLAVYGIDGTSFKVPDSDDNEAEFGLATNGDNSGYPLVRLVALMDLRSHLIAAASFGAFNQGEYHYASSLWRLVPDNSVTVVDRHFLSASILSGLQRSGLNRHWLTRAKSSTTSKLVEQLGPNDQIVEMKVSPQARKRDPSLGKTWSVRVIDYQFRGHRPQKLVTSLLDPEQYPAHELVELYHERWELELGYREIKSTMLQQTTSTLRSQKPEGVRQEIWGTLIAYNLIRREMLHAAEQAGVLPTRISFIAAYRLITDEWSWSERTATPGAIPRHLRELEAALLHFMLPERRAHRRYPRAVKTTTKYPRKRRNQNGSSISREGAESRAPIIDAAK